MKTLFGLLGTIASIGIGYALCYYNIIPIAIEFFKVAFNK